MGIVTSRPEDGGALYLRDQSRFSLSSLTITNSRKRVLLTITPNTFPATKVVAKREGSDESIIEFIQDPDPVPQNASPSFLLRLSNEDELNFNFTFAIRQPWQGQQAGLAAAGPNGKADTGVDTTINGLTYVFASNTKDLDTLVTREFHADPNLHKNSNVHLVGDFSTKGSPYVHSQWSWKWRPPKAAEDRGGGWRNSCSFVEYDQRAHRLDTLATFSFWVQNTQRLLASPQSPFGSFELTVPPKLRVPSSQSIQSRLSDSDTAADYREPASPIVEIAPEAGLGLSHTITNSTIKVDISCPKPGEDMSAVDDGPLFRATMKALEQKTGNMRTKMKKVLRKAEGVQAAQEQCNAATEAFMGALREASTSNAHAVQPALEHYFEKIAREILSYEQQNTLNLQKMIIDPLTKLYTLDIKQAESKRKDFDEESRDYYAFLGRYLGQRQDSLKEKKRAESDTKYQSKRRNFELKRFDYSSFMQDLHGGRKEQEVLSHLTRYADAQAKSYLATAKKVEDMIPQLEALNYEVRETDKEYQLLRTEREEKRRTIEKSTQAYLEPETSSAPSLGAGTTNGHNSGDAELGRKESGGTGAKQVPTLSTVGSAIGGAGTVPNAAGGAANSSKFKGIRDLEEKDYSTALTMEKSAGQERKEGLLWALSRPGSHVDPKGLNKQAWHKFWIVLDQGKVSEYSNWKQKLDLHMDPIDLRMASVREARNAERRFCFEIITPQFKRVYQATSEEDMTNWIVAINNALQSAVEGRSVTSDLPAVTGTSTTSRRDIGSILTGKSSSSVGHGQHHSAAGNANNVYRRTTVGARPTYGRTASNSYEENPSKLLQLLRDADQGNWWCADCGSGLKSEWVSINLGIILCIECSGIHRSLGTHITKVRSLTLDTTSFTTDIVELLLLIGNRVSNMVWEAKLDRALKPSPHATREQRLRFITSKYADRAYVTPLSSSLSRFSTAEETLLASVKKNDIQGVLYALALRANPNATDRSRSTPAIFLALAAADPAPPGTSSLGGSPSHPPAPPKNIPFPVAELLVQNGAIIPNQPPAFPLSASARLYIDQKSGRPAISKGGDTLGDLPTIGSIGGTDGSSFPDRTRERDARLQKRVSAGGRLTRAGYSMD